MALAKGDKAPSFKLFNTEKKERSLDDFKGKTLILHFFPQAFTGTCTKQLCAVRDDISRYHNDRCEVVAVSVDSAFTLGKFKELQNLQFDLLSDFNREASPLYTGFYETFAMGMKGVSKRAVFVIDANGIIQHAEIRETPGDMPDFAALNADLDNVLGISASN
jgi:peroxiredoxin